MNQRETIEQFYTAFSAGDLKEMLNCYHDEIVFEDPAFGQLKGVRAKAMWQMLLSRREKSGLTLQFSLDQNSDNKATWIATYNYGPKKRKVVNSISAQFKFKDEKIIQHTDSFDLWKWTQQALGTSGYLLGWSNFMKQKIQKTTHKALDQFIAKQTT
ncbi:MAG: nuclear transport factor 2 family protein [Flavobacteriales bacterium]|nr:nuclear transport factor 2 family protein [Flavobacteriales bacterium]